MPSETTPLQPNDQISKPESTLRKGLNQISDLFYQPFSNGALSKLPARGEGMRAKSKRSDRIPDESLVSDYLSINDPSVRIRIPKKVATPVKVEAKVWFANERTFISYLSMGLLLSTIASGLLLGARDSPSRWFALAYASISAGVLIYGWVIFQKRLTMISARHAGDFDILWGPLLICVTLFVAILANFILRLQDARQATGLNPMSFSQAWYQAGIKKGI